MNAYFYYFYNFMRSIFDNIYNLAIAFKIVSLEFLTYSFIRNCQVLITRICPLLAGLHIL